jgi:hypothetical protein
MRKWSKENAQPRDPKTGKFIKGKKKKNGK